MSNITRALEKIFKRLVVPKVNDIYDRLGIDNSIRIEVNDKVGERKDKGEYVDTYHINIYFRNGGPPHSIYFYLGYLLYLTSRYIITNDEYVLVIYFVRGELKSVQSIYSSEERENPEPTTFDELLKDIEDSLSPLES